jgi:hypothetical protein
MVEKDKKKVAILQSNYIPWKGYFDIINSVDEFIIYDDVQYTRRDWRNRNKIKTPSGTIWLNIPVQVSGKFFQSIKETKVVGCKWTKKHWESIKRNYSKAKYFKDYKGIFEGIYLKEAVQYKYLSDINYLFIKTINGLLDINTKISWSSDYVLEGDKTEKLVNLCKQANSTEYFSGPAGKNYIEEEFFNNTKIQLTWMNYSNYPEYQQLFPPFEHSVTILDLIFNCGPTLIKYMKSFKQV